METLAQTRGSEESGALNETLDALFAPRSIAILGASGRETNPFAKPLKYLVEYGYEGKIYPINPGYESLHGIPCYPDVASIPGPVDLTLALIPAAGIEAQLPALAAAGTRVVVVFASGFGEVGDEGKAMQASLVETARQHGIRLIGPNCQGVLSVENKTYGTFTPALSNGPIQAGGLSWVGQSGAVGGSILSLAQERGIGIANWVSTGNQADLESIEISRYLLEQEDTKVLALYLETSVNEDDFRGLAMRANELGKSLVVLRSATSPVGARAAASHTGAIIGDDAALKVVVREQGVVLVDDIDELVRISHAHLVMPRMTGNRLTVVSTSGGAGSIAADAAYEAGLDVVTLSEGAQASLSEFVPDFGAVDNPIDVTAQIFSSGTASEFVSVCRRTLEFEEVDATMIVLTLVVGDIAVSMAKAIVESNFDKPLAIVWSAARTQTAEAREILRQRGIPVFDSIRQATAALKSLVRTPSPEAATTRPAGYEAGRVRELVQEFGAGAVHEGSANALLAAAGVPHPKSRLLTDVSQVADAANELNAPYVVKVQADSVLHKTERGGVVLGVETTELADTVSRMFDIFTDDQPEGVLVSEMAPAGVELIFGVTRAAISGIPMVTVGLGGTATEIYRDTVTSFAPITSERAAELVMGLQAAPLLTGFRGSAPVDIVALSDAIERLSWMAVDAGDALGEFEINPLRATPQGVLALDFLMVLDPKEGS